jgi:colicin import membrane protein
LTACIAVKSKLNAQDIDTHKHALEEAHKVADDNVKKAVLEAEARQQAEKRAADEAKARHIAEKRTAEAEKRAAHEAKRAADEAKARALAEERVLEMQAQIRQLQKGGV